MTNPPETMNPSATTNPPVPSRPEAEIGLAFSPRQILGGFVMIAALIALLSRRRRGGKASGR